MIDLKKSIYKLFKPKISKVIGIDIGAGSVKMAQVNFSGKMPEVVTLCSKPLPLDLGNGAFVRNRIAMADFLKEALNEESFSAAHVVFTIGGRNAFVRAIEMPDMPAVQMKQAVAWDAGQYVPYEADSYYVDSVKFGEINEDKMQPVLLVAAPKEMVDALADIADQMEMTVLSIDIEVLALYRTLSKTYSDFVMLDIGKGYSMLTIFQKGAPVAQRSIPQGGQMFDAALAKDLNISLLAAEEYKIKNNILGSLTPDDKEKHSSFFNEVENLGREVRRTCDYYKMNKKNAEFSNLLIVGGGSDMPGLKEFFKNSIEFSVVGNDLHQAVGFSDKIPQSVLKKGISGFGVAIGAALVGGDTDD